MQIHREARLPPIEKAVKILVQGMAWLLSFGLTMIGSFLQRLWSCDFGFVTSRIFQL